MKIQDIISVMEQFAAPELQEDYDNAGLITGSADWKCSGVLCVLDVTPDVMREAKENGCNMVLAHHPIIFRGLKKINGKNYVEQVIIEAIKNDIAIYACHTNLDNIYLGVNSMIAKRLNLLNTSILLPKKRVLRRLITFAPKEKASGVRQAMFDAGAGKIGKYAECSFNSEGLGSFKAMPGADPYIGEVGSIHFEKETKIEVVYPFYLEDQVVKALISNHPYEEVAYDIFTMENVHVGIGSGMIGNLNETMDEKDFLNSVQKAFQTKTIRHSPFLNRKISKVAVCGGSGSFLIPRARALGADIFVTADLKYHEFFESEGRILLADIGHYESEQYTIDLMHDILVEKNPNFAVLKTRLNTNPVQYLNAED
jgi:dinuclear metal center YbgI/SA1388 family protein